LVKRSSNGNLAFFNKLPSREFGAIPLGVRKGPTIGILGGPKLPEIKGGWQFWNLVKGGLFCFCHRGYGGPGAKKRLWPLETV